MGSLSTRKNNLDPLRESPSDRALMPEIGKVVVGSGSTSQVEHHVSLENQLRYGAKSVRKTSRNSDKSTMFHNHGAFTFAGAPSRHPQGSVMGWVDTRNQARDGAKKQ